MREDRGAWRSVTNGVTTWLEASYMGSNKMPRPAPPRPAPPRPAPPRPAPPRPEQTHENLDSLPSVEDSTVFESGRVPHEDRDPLLSGGYPDPETYLPWYPAWKANSACIAAMARRWTSSAVEAEDVSQAALLYLLERHVQGAPAPVHLRAFLAPVIRHIARDLGSVRKREEALPESEGLLPAHPSNGLLAWVRDELARYLSSVPRVQLDLLVLHHGRGLSIEQISRRTGLKEGTIKSRISRCLKHLRECANDRAENPESLRARIE